MSRTRLSVAALGAIVLAGTMLVAPAAAASSVGTATAPASVVMAAQKYTLVGPFTSRTVCRQNENVHLSRGYRTSGCYGYGTTWYFLSTFIV